MTRIPLGTKRNNDEVREAAGTSPQPQPGITKHGNGSTWWNRRTLMRFREKLPGYMGFLIKRILLLIPILLLTSPSILMAQELRLPCNKVRGGSDLSPVSCDQNEFDSGLDGGSGTTNPPVQATNSGDNDW